ncbi:MAG: DUF397 domain-containing protein [Sulfuricella sp.]
MSEKSFPESAFKKSSFSGKFDGNMNCVEVAITTNSISVRDSKDKAQLPLQFTRSEWIAFIQGVKSGELDLL